MRHPAGVGALFANKAKSNFVNLTRTRFDAMLKRLVKKKAIPDIDHPPFTLEAYRAFVIAGLGGFPDGARQCRYCHGYFGYEDLATDHAVPLDCGGSPGIENLDLPCANCNRQKGVTTPDEFLIFLKFLEEKLPRARTSILHRLQTYSKLIAGMRSDEPIKGELKASGQWQQVQAARRAKNNQPADDGMPEF